MKTMLLLVAASSLVCGLEAMYHGDITQDFKNTVESALLEPNPQLCAANYRALAAGVAKALFPHVTRRGNHQIVPYTDPVVTEEERNVAQRAWTHYTTMSEMFEIIMQERNKLLTQEAPLDLDQHRKRARMNSPQDNQVEPHYVYFGNFRFEVVR